MDTKQLHTSNETITEANLVVGQNYAWATGITGADEVIYNGNHSWTATNNGQSKTIINDRLTASVLVVLNNSLISTGMIK